MKDKNTDLLLRTGHRERLRQNFLDDKLADYEILELLLSYAIPRRDVRPLARTLLHKFGGIYPILSASVEDLSAIAGIGNNTAIFIKVVQKIMLLGYESHAKSDAIFLNRQTLENYCKLMLGGKTIEEMHVLYLDPDGRLMKQETHSHGTPNEAALFTNEITRNAIVLHAYGVVLIHNHPRANLSFSSQDIQITQELARQLKICDIKLVDHYLVSGGVLYSMRDSYFLEQL